MGPSLKKCNQNVARQQSCPGLKPFREILAKTCAILCSDIELAHVFRLKDSFSTLLERIWTTSVEISIVDIAVFFGVELHYFVSPTPNSMAVAASCLNRT